MSTNRNPESPYRPLHPKDRQAVAVAIKGAEGPDAKESAKGATVLAAGRGALAEKILDLAFAGGLPVREDADLAGLLATLELDTPIPSEAIIAVAEILARVYEANAHLGALASFPSCSAETKGSE